LCRQQWRQGPGFDTVGANEQEVKMTTWAMVVSAIGLAALAYFFFRMRAVAREIDRDCVAMMNVALSLTVVIPLGLCLLGVGMAQMSQGGAMMVAAASALSVASGLVLIPVILMNGLRRMKQTEEERMENLFD
jgi:hypothetical protein